MGNALAAPAAVAFLVLWYVFGTTRLAALLIYPAVFAMPRGTRWMLLGNPIPGQQYGRLWAFIGDVGLSILPLLPLLAGLYRDPGQDVPISIVLSAVIVAWTVIILVLAVRTRSRFNPPPPG